jgi:hypothetical protein
MKQKVVIIGAGAELQESVAGAVDERWVGILNVPSGEAARALHDTIEIDLLVVVLPMEDATFEEFVVSLGSSDLPRIVVIADEAEYLRLSSYESDQLTVLPSRLPAANLAGLCTQFVRAAPRAVQRLMARLEVQIGDTSRLRMVQTLDISETGMKVVTSELLPIGTSVGITFNWPGDPEPIVGEAEVVRHTSQETERVRGMGIRFTAFHGQGGQRLREYIRQSVEGQELA